MKIPTPKLFTSNSFQAWVMVIVLALLIVVVYDNYTGKKMLSFFGMGKKTKPADPANPPQKPPVA